jgi:hypothetical protein
LLICGALVLAFVLAWALIPHQRDTGIAHFKRGEELKMTGDYKGAKQELEVCLSECKGWEGNTAREELERIEPLIAAQGQPQQAHPTAEPQAASPDQNTVAERVGAEQADAVKSRLSCNSERPLVDGRSLVMNVVRQGDKLRVTQYAVNGPGNLDPLFTFLFTQDDEGHWVSYQAAAKTEATIMFDDNYGNVGQYIGWNFYIAKYNDSTKLYSDLVGDAKGKCYRN